MIRLKYRLELMHTLGRVKSHEFRRNFKFKIIYLTIKLNYSEDRATS